MVSSPEYDLRFLTRISGRDHPVILTACYAAGLSTAAITRMRSTGIDSRHIVLWAALSKAAKDRYVVLIPRLLEILRKKWPYA